MCLYRSNGDILLALTNALHKLSRPAVGDYCTAGNEEKGTDMETDSMECVLNDVSKAMHDQIQVFLQADAKHPYHFAELDINSLVSKINPILWNAICKLTQSVSERVGKGKGKGSNVKTVRRIFCLCALMFCTNDRCCIPLHNLITDMVDGLGGSTLLVKILNRLGVCSSADTLARAIQYRVTERERKGVQSECSSTAFTILSTLTSCIVMLGFFVVTRNEAGMEPQYSWFNHNRPIYTKIFILAKTMKQVMSTVEGNVMWTDLMRLRRVEVQHQKFKEGLGQRWKHTKHLQLQETHNKHFTRLSLECMLLNLACTR